MSTSMHGGRLAAARLRGHGVSKLFTLSGGHLFSLYDGALAEQIEIVDVRHEQTAAFAAEGWAKVTRQPGVCALTAGPGVTNGLSAMGGALSNRSPMVVIGGRAPAVRWGQGSLQEVDHLPFVAPLTRLAPPRTARPTSKPRSIWPSRPRRVLPVVRRSSTSRSTTCSWKASLLARSLRRRPSRASTTSSSSAPLRCCAAPSDRW